MADETPKKPKRRPSGKGFLLPALVGACVTIVIGLFVLGYLNLTTPPPPPEDVHSLLAAKKQQDEAATTAGDNTTDSQEKIVVNEDGTFDFAQYRYFTFPLPFVTNLADGNGMLTAEIAVATYEKTLRGEKLIEKLTTFTPKMRSTINLILAEQVDDNINSVAKRRALERRLLSAIKPIIDGSNPAEPSGITDLHFIKFVTTGVR